MNILGSFYWVLAASLWYFVNGALHDVFIVINHKGKYDRELLRLLMDGHVLMLSGLISIVCFFMLRNGIQSAGLISLITGIFMIIYCLMIFPFLKSFVTMGISGMLIIASVAVLKNAEAWDLFR